TMMAMRHGVLPPTLHADRPSPHVDWSAGSVSLLTRAVPWPRTDRPRRAAVSAFGVGGTNAHVVLEDPPPEPAQPEPAHPGSAPCTPGGTGDLLPWVVSGRSERALGAQATRLLAHLGNHRDLRVPDVGLSLATTRSRFEYRAVLLSGDRTGFLEALAALAS